MNPPKRQVTVEWAILASHVSMALWAGMAHKAEKILEDMPSLPPSALSFCLALTAGADRLSEPWLSKLLSAEALAELDDRSMNAPLPAGERMTPMEYALDCTDRAHARRALDALDFVPSRACVAKAIRMSEDFKKASERFEAARSLNLLDSRLLSLLAEHSSWCENGIESLATAERERRALARASTKAPAAPKPRL